MENSGDTEGCCSGNSVCVHKLGAKRGLQTNITLPQTSEETKPDTLWSILAPRVLNPVFQNVTSLEGPYQGNPLMTKNKTIKCRLREYSNWLNFKKPLDNRRLCQAVSMNDSATVIHLLNQGVSASCYDNQLRSPLHLASCKGYAHIVKILLDHGANPNARDSIGNTPLHLAACTNHIDVVMLLLKAGTNTSITDQLGRNPLQLAQSKLRVLRRSRSPDKQIKDQITQVIEMLLHFSSVDDDLSKRMDTVALNDLHEKVKKSDTREQVDTQLKELLDNLGTLTLT